MPERHKSQRIPQSSFLIIACNGDELNPEHASVLTTASEFALLPGSARLSSGFAVHLSAFILEIEAEIPGALPKVVGTVTGKPNPEKGANSALLFPSNLGRHSRLECGSRFLRSFLRLPRRCRHHCVDICRSNDRPYTNTLLVGNASCIPVRKKSQTI